MQPYAKEHARSMMVEYPPLQELRYSKERNSSPRLKKRSLRTLGGRGHKGQKSRSVCITKPDKRPKEHGVIESSLNSQKLEKFH